MLVFEEFMPEGAPANKPTGERLKHNMVIDALLTVIVKVWGTDGLECSSILHRL